MSDSILKNAEANYSAPLCEVLNVGTEGVLCQSYGEPGAAGANGSYSSIGEDF